MLWETIERVNQSRQRAMSDSDFIQSAHAHQQALRYQENRAYTSTENKRKQSKKTRPKTFAEKYQPTEHH